MTPEALRDRALRRTRAKLDQAPVIRWRQLCAIVADTRRQSLHAGETFSAWAERSILRLQQLGFRFELADKQALERAQWAVERTHGPVPVLTTSAPLVHKPAPADMSLTSTEASTWLDRIRQAAARRSA